MCPPLPASLTSLALSSAVSSFAGPSHPSAWNLLPAGVFCARFPHLSAVLGSQVADADPPAENGRLPSAAQRLLYGRFASEPASELALAACSPMPSAKPLAHPPSQRPAAKRYTCLTTASGDLQIYPQFALTLTLCPSRVSLRFCLASPQHNTYLAHSSVRVRLCASYRILRAAPVTASNAAADSNPQGWA